MGGGEVGAPNLHIIQGPTVHGFLVETDIKISLWINKYECVLKESDEAVLGLLVYRYCREVRFSNDYPFLSLWN